MLAGQLEIQLFANMARLQTDMAEAKKHVAEASEVITESAETAKKALEALGIGLSVMEFKEFVMGAIEAADEMGKLSQKIGIAVEDLGAYTLAAAQSGMGMETFAKAVKKLSTYMVDHSDALAAAGLSAKDANEELLKIADLFHDMPDGVLKTATAVTLFGKAGIEMIPMLNKGSEGMQEMMEKGRALNAITAESAHGAEEFVDKLIEAKAYGTRFAQTLATEMTPALTAVVDAYVDYRREAGDANALTGGIVEVFKVIVVLGANVVYVLKSIASEITGIATQIVALAHFDWQGFKGIGAQMKQDADEGRAAIDKFSESIMHPVEAAKEAHREMDATRAAEAEARARQLRGANANAQAAIDAMNNARAASAKAEAALEAEIEDAAIKGQLNQLDAFHAAKLMSDADYYTQHAALEQTYNKIQLDRINKQQAIEQAAYDASVAGSLDEEKHWKTLNELATKAQTALEKYNEAGLKERIRLLGDEDAELQKVIDSEQKREGVAELQITAWGEQIDAHKQEIALFEASAMGRAQNVLQQKILNDQIAIQKQLEKDLIGLTDAGTVARLTAAAEEAKANAAAYETAKAKSTEFETTWQSVNSTAQQAFVNIFNKGADAFTRLRDTLKNTLLDLLYQMTLKQWVFNITASVTGGLAAGAANAAGSGLGNIAGSGLNIAGSGAAYGAIGGGGAADMLAAQTGDFGLAGLSATADALGSTAAASFTGALAAIPGWGWAAAGVAALFGGSLFGGGGGPMTSGTAGDYAMFGKSPNPDDTQGAQMLTTVNALKASYADTAKALGGVAGDLKLMLHYSSDPQGTAPDDGYSIGSVNGKQFGYASDYGRGSMTASMPQLISRTLLEALQATDLSPVANALVRGLDPKTITDTALAQVQAAIAGYSSLFTDPALVTSTNTLRTNLVTLQDQFSAAGVSGAVSADNLRNAVMALDLTSAAGQQAARDLLTLAPAVKQYEDGLLAMIGFTRSSLATAFLDAIKNSPDAATAGMTFAQNIVDGIHTALLGNLAQQITDIVTSGIVTPTLNALLTGQSVSEALSAANMQTVIDKAKAVAGAFSALWNNSEFQQAMTTLKSTIEGATASAMAAAKGAAVTTGTVASTITSTITSTTSDVTAAFNALKSSIASEKAAITQAYNDNVAALNAGIAATNTAIGNMTSLSNALRGTLNQLQGAAGNAATSRADAQAQIASALAIAKAGGALPDAATLQNALTVVAQPSQDLFASFTDYQRDFAQTANNIDNLATLTDLGIGDSRATLQIQQAQLAQLTAGYTAETSRLDNILATAQTQVDALNGINSSVLSVADALAGLSGAMSRAATTPQSQTDTKLAGIIAQAQGGDIPGAVAAASGSYSAAQLAAAWNAANPNNPTTASNITEGAHALGIPGFASGGDFGGGMRLVGENGPELEVTGPSRIVSNGDLTSRMRDPALLDEIRALREEIRAGNIAIASNTQKSAMLADRWEGNGIPVRATDPTQPIQVHTV